MDTNTHSLAIFLHPLCRKLAISQAANGWMFEFMVTMALSIAKQWKWSKQQANKQQEDLRQYNQSKGVFIGAIKIL
jgi:hypothetical protein